MSAVPSCAAKPLAAGHAPLCGRDWPLDAAFALSALVAAVMRLATTAPGERWLPPVVGIATLNGLIAVLFLLRRPAIAIGSLSQLAACLPTMIGFGLALKLAPEPAHWPWYAHALFAAGVALALASFVALGGSFAVLPSLRQPVQRGPYRLIRHPAYAGELLMAAACLVAGPSPAAITPWLLLAPGVAWRIAAEEAILSRDDAYVVYQRQVRWRILPGIW